MSRVHLITGVVESVVCTTGLTHFKPLILLFFFSCAANLKYTNLEGKWGNLGVPVLVSEIVV